jgi:hypothetical protein
MQISESVPHSVSTKSVKQIMGYALCQVGFIMNRRG